MDLDNVQAGRPVFRQNRGAVSSRMPANTRGTFWRKRNGGTGNNGSDERKSLTRNSFKSKRKGRCFKCGKQGHHAFECRQKLPQKFHNVETESLTEFCNFADPIAQPCHSSEDFQDPSQLPQEAREGACSTAEATASKVLQKEDEEGDDVAHSSKREIGPEMDQEGGLDEPLN